MDTQQDPVTFAEVVQLLIAVGWAAAFMAAFDVKIENGGVVWMLLGVGYFGLKATMFVYVWHRHGWRSARTLCLFGNEPDSPSTYHYIELEPGAARHEPRG